LEDGGCLRRLIYVPVVHSAMEVYGKAVSEEIKNLSLNTDPLWDLIEKELEELNLDYSKVHLYQDSLPDLSDAQLIYDGVLQLAEDGSRNFQVLLKLFRKGGTLEGTESAGIWEKFFRIERNLRPMISEPRLVWELRKIMVICQYKFSGEIPFSVGNSYESVMEYFVDLRDRYIGKKISQTLRDGETGILFIGARHSANKYLADDIEVKVLDKVGDWITENMEKFLKNGNARKIQEIRDRGEF